MRMGIARRTNAIHMAWALGWLRRMLDKTSANFPSVAARQRAAHGAAERRTQPSTTEAAAGPTTGRWRQRDVTDNDHRGVCDNTGNHASGPPAARE